MAFYPGDDTILTNNRQTDKWTITHVLLFYFFMWNGLDWHWAVLIAYLWKGFEATAWGGYTASVPDGLIVDPLQATMGVVVFMVLQHWKLARVSIKMPRLRADAPTAAWLAKMLYWGLAVVANQPHNWQSYDGEKWVVALPLMFAVNIGLDRHTYGCTWGETLAVCWAPFLYFLSFGVCFFVVSSIPYNPFFASLWFHIPAFVVQAGLVARRRLTEAHTAEAHSPDGAADEQQDATGESLLPLQSLFSLRPRSRV